MNNEKFMIEALTRDVVALIMKENKKTMREAMDAFLGSQTFEALSRTETGLYIQSPIYILDEYRQEKNELGCISK